MGTVSGIAAATCFAFALFLQLGKGAIPSLDFGAARNPETVGQLLMPPREVPTFPEVGFNLLPTPPVRRPLEFRFASQSETCQWHTYMLEALTSETTGPGTYLNHFNFEMSDPETFLASLRYLKQHPGCLPPDTLVDCDEKLIDEVTRTPEQFLQPDGIPDAGNMPLWYRRMEFQQCLSDVFTLRLRNKMDRLKDRSLASLLRPEDLADVVLAGVLGPSRAVVWDLIPTVEKWVALYTDRRDLPHEMNVQLKYAAMTMARPGRDAEMATAAFLESMDQWKRAGGRLAHFPDGIEAMALRLERPEEGFTRFTHRPEPMVHDTRLYYHAWDVAQKGETERALELLELLTGSSFDSYGLYARVAITRLKRGQPADAAFFPHSVSLGYHASLRLDGDGNKGITFGQSRDFGPLALRDVYNEKFPELGLPYVKHMRSSRKDWQVMRQRMEEALLTDGLPTAHPR